MIYFENWNIRADTDGPVRQFDRGTQAFDVRGELPAGWEWTLLVRAGEEFDLISMEEGEGGLYVPIESQRLTVSGYYTLQLRARQGELVRHTNLVSVYVPASLSGDEAWPEVPGEFTSCEERVLAAAERAEEAILHPPVIGENGNWQAWDAEAREYEDTGLPSRGAAGATGAAGAAGETGAAGQDGKSAYDSAREGGFAGTQAQFNAALADPYRAFACRSVSSAGALSVSDGAEGLPVRALKVRGTDAGTSLTVTREGETLTLYQGVRNGDFAGAADSDYYTRLNGSVSAEGNVGTYTVTAVAPGYSAQGFTMPTSMNIPLGHVVLMRVDARFPHASRLITGLWNAGALVYAADATNLFDVADTDWHTYTSYFTLTSGGALSATNAGVRIPPASGRLAVGDRISFRNFVVFDLTAIYGAGNEPTAEEFCRDFPDAYYAYTLGTKMSRPHAQASFGPYQGENWSVPTPAGVSGAYVWDVPGGTVECGGAVHAVEPQTVTTLRGINRVRADDQGGACGVEAVYRVDPTIAYENLETAVISLGGNI